MRKISLRYVIGLSVMLMIGIYSCKKVNGINNNEVIETPYSLFFGDSTGSLYSTNDGKTILKLAFQPDGKPTRAICVSGNNILWAKNNLYVSTNNGLNFNHAFDSLSSFSGLTCTGMVLDLNNSMIINIPSWNNRVYVCSYADADMSGTTDYLGLAHSDDHNGERGDWKFSNNSYDTNSNVGVLPVKMRSMTFLPSGVLCGIAVDISSTDSFLRNFYKNGQDDSGNPWLETTGNPGGYNLSLLTINNQSGNPLPPNPTYTQKGYFTLGHFNNRLIAVDGSCTYGAFYSDDTGRNWVQYQGLTGIGALCIGSPFEEVCLVGTAGHGVYILNLHTSVFEPSNNGLGSNLTVRGIAAKENILKNGTVQKYIYIATNQGIYQSVDGGLNWTLVFAGNFTAIY